MRRISVQERCVVELIRSMFISTPDNWIQVTHGVYGSMLQALGTCIGLLGAVPCCPCPNPFREVYQGAFPVLEPSTLHPIAFGTSFERHEDFHIKAKC